MGAESGAQCRLPCRGGVPSVNSGVIGPARLQAWRALTPRHHGRKVGKEEEEEVEGIWRPTRGGGGGGGGVVFLGIAEEGK